MATELFIPKRFQAKKLALLEQANIIIAEYQERGYTLTGRQCFYQFVARDWLPNNKFSYRDVLTILREGRDAGEIDWDAIVDRGRKLHTWGGDTSPSDAIEYAADNYREDYWRDQPRHVEVWVEKEALAEVVGEACGEYYVSYMAVRGDNSHSILYEAAKRFVEKCDQGQEPLVLFLSDHDPAGIDMERVTRETLGLYAHQEIEVKRIGLTWERAHDRTRRLPANRIDAVKEANNKRLAAYVRQFKTKDEWEPTRRRRVSLSN